MSVKTPPMEAHNPIRLLRRLLRQLFSELIDIKSDTAAAKTITEISDSIHFRGYNVWILICSAMLASIGLDVNSVAVIIGAMLISPLMSPILGVGLGLGVNDRTLLFRALFNLGAFTAVAFLTACGYFLITPLGELTAEMQARTQPTLLDVMVAFFGGVAGIVSSSRNRITNAVPGVAIATALMPPLCTSAFGLVSGQWPVFLGSLYLYGINAIFIALATFLIVKYLKFPARTYLSPVVQRTVTRTVTLVLIVFLAPSIYFLFRVWQERRAYSQVKQIIESRVASDSTEVLKWELARQDSLTYVKLFLAGHPLPPDSISGLNERLRDAGLRRYRFSVKQVNVDPAELESMKRELSRSLLSMAETMPERYEPQSIEVKPVEPEPNAEQVRSLERELHALFPDLETVAFGMLYQPKDSAGVDTLPTLRLAWKGRFLGGRRADEKSIERFVRERLELDTLVLARP